MLLVQADLGNFGLDRAEDDLAASQENIASAQEELRSARRHFDRDPLMRLGQHLPGAGPQLQALDQIIDIGLVTTELGGEAVALGDEARMRRENESEAESPAVALVELMDDMAPSLDRVERLSIELASLRIRLGDGALLSPLHRARNQLDEHLPDLLGAVEQLSYGRSALSSMLGFHGERRYLVLTLNNGQLLPGGGLVTAAGVMTVRDGMNGPIEFTDSTRWKDDWEAAGGGYIEPPGPLRRYLLRDYPWNLLVSNWNPDFPTWAQQALEFYELVHGPQDVDGVVAVDLVVVERLLELLGPVELDLPDVGSTEFNAENVVLELERYTRQPFDPGEDRKATIGDLAAPLLDRLYALPADEWGTLYSLMRDLAAGDHVQMLSFHPQEQSAIRFAGFDGAMDRSPGDYLSVNEASVLSTKISLILERDAEHSIDISDGVARHALKLSYHNPLPAWAEDHDPELVDALMGNGRYGAYVRIFVPTSSTRFKVELDGEPAALEDRGIEAGRAWVGVFVPISAGAKVDIKFQWQSSAGEPENTGNYRLRVQKQPGLQELCTRFIVTVDGEQADAVLNGQPLGSDPVCLTRDATIALGAR